MKRLYIIVEGQTEQEFINSVLAPYLLGYKIYTVTPILIRTSKTGRGGFVNYEHLKNDAKRLLSSTKTDFVVTMFVDFFRIPQIPHPERWSIITDPLSKIDEMEKCIGQDINDRRFIPYIQLHEFESLLFSSNKGFSAYYPNAICQQTQEIINNYTNPEFINSSPTGAPSKRLLKIKPDYDKVIDGNLIAMEVGLDAILDKCPRFKQWVDLLISVCK